MPKRHNKRHNKDYLGKLINHIMRHGKKATAIGILATSLSLFRHKLLRQGAAPLKRMDNRPQLSCVPLDATALPSLRDKERCCALNTDTNGSKCGVSPIRSSSSQLTKPENCDTNTGKVMATKSSLNQSKIGYVISPFLVVTSANTPVRWDDATSVEGPVRAWVVDSGRARAADLDVRSVFRNKNLVQERGGEITRPVKDYVKDAISNIKPSLETRNKKIAGITRHVPSIVSPSRGEGLAIRWITAAARETQRRMGKGVAQCLSDELLDAYLKRGGIRQKRDSLHKVAESNRSYIRYRWW